MVKMTKITLEFNTKYLYESFIERWEQSRESEKDILVVSNWPLFENRLGSAVFHPDLSGELYDPIRDALTPIPQEIKDIHDTDVEDGPLGSARKLLNDKMDYGHIEPKWIKKRRNEENFRVYGMGLYPGNIPFKDNSIDDIIIQRFFYDPDGWYVDCNTLVIGGHLHMHPEKMQLSYWRGLYYNSNIQRAIENLARITKPEGNIHIVERKLPALMPWEKVEKYFADLGYKVEHGFQEFAKPRDWAYVLTAAQR